MKHIIRGLGATLATVSVLGMSVVGSAAADSYSSMHLHRQFPRRQVEVTHINNINNVRISNNVSQVALSGNATVSGNKFGGSARTGNASNVSNITTTVNINNNNNVR